MSPSDPRPVRTAYFSIPPLARRISEKSPEIKMPVSPRDAFATLSTLKAMGFIVCDPNGEPVVEEDPATKPALPSE